MPHAVHIAEESKQRGGGTEATLLRSWKVTDFRVKHHIEEHEQNGGPDLL